MSFLKRERGVQANVEMEGFISYHNLKGVMGVRLLESLGFSTKKPQTKGRMSINQYWIQTTIVLIEPKTTNALVFKVCPKVVRPLHEDFQPTQIE